LTHRMSAKSKTKLPQTDFWPSSIPTAKLKFMRKLSWIFYPSD